MDIDQLYINLGKSIRDARVRYNMTQEDLANKLGLQRTSISNIESGNQRIQLHTLYMLSNVLDVDLKLLLPETSTFDFGGLKKHLSDKNDLSADEKQWIRQILTEDEAK